MSVPPPEDAGGTTITGYGGFDLASFEVDGTPVLDIKPWFAEFGPTRGSQASAVEHRDA